jgi:hypothetical protein
MPCVRVLRSCVWYEGQQKVLEGKWRGRARFANGNGCRQGDEGVLEDDEKDLVGEGGGLARDHGDGIGEGWAPSYGIPRLARVAFELLVALGAGRGSSCGRSPRLARAATA